MAATTVISRGEVGWRLRQLRAFARGTSLRAVQEATGVPHSTLDRLEQGTAKLDAEYLQRLCDFYSRSTAVPVTLRDLLDPDYDTRVWLNPAA